MVSAGKSAWAVKYQLNIVLKLSGWILVHTRSLTCRLVMRLVIYLKLSLVIHNCMQADQ